MAAFLWALYAVLMTWLVVAADDFPQCPTIRPDKTLLVLVAFVIAAVAIASLVLVARARTLTAYGFVLLEIPLALAWIEIDGGAASCLIG